MITIKNYEHCIELLHELSVLGFDKKVFDELGCPIYSNESHSWYLAYDDNKLVGFCASIDKNGYKSFNHDYVIPEYRKQGVYNNLFTSRMFDSVKSKIKAVATSKSVNLFINKGFTVTRKTKNYYFVEFTPKN